MQNLTINPFNIKDTMKAANTTSTSQPVIGRAYLNSTARLSVTQGGRQIGQFVTGGTAQARGGKKKGRKKETTLVLRTPYLVNS
jgi:hypothetical protein